MPPREALGTNEALGASVADAGNEGSPPLFPQLPASLGPVLTATSDATMVSESEVSEDKERDPETNLNSVSVAGPAPPQEDCAIACN